MYCMESNLVLFLEEARADMRVQEEFLRDLERKVLTVAGAMLAFYGCGGSLGKSVGSQPLSTRGRRGVHDRRGDCTLSRVPNAQVE